MWVVTRVVLTNRVVLSAELIGCDALLGECGAHLRSPLSELLPRCHCISSRRNDADANERRVRIGTPTSARSYLDGSIGHRSWRGSDDKNIDYEMCSIYKQSETTGEIFENVTEIESAGSPRENRPPRD
jgi:hypothetical protein